MSEHKCNSCFYMQNERSRNPCNVCEGYNKYVNRNIYIHQPAVKGEDYFTPDTITIKEWDDPSLEEDTFDGYYGGSEDYVQKAHDAVSNPKHYMLFEDKGIEVRDVIEKLVIKIQDQIKNDDYPQGYAEPMFIADYVQMVQYLMRFMEKNGKEDLKKARWYLDKLIEAYE